MYRIESAKIESDFHFYETKVDVYDSINFNTRACAFVFAFSKTSFSIIQSKRGAVASSAEALEIRILILSSDSVLRFLSLIFSSSMLGGLMKTASVFSEISF